MARSGYSKGTIIVIMSICFHASILFGQTGYYGPAEGTLSFTTPPTFKYAANNVPAGKDKNAMRFGVKVVTTGGPGQGQLVMECRNLDSPDWKPFGTNQNIAFPTPATPDTITRDTDFFSAPGDCVLPLSASAPGSDVELRWRLKRPDGTVAATLTAQPQTPR
jgi:hypothetical protein